MKLLPPMSAAELSRFRGPAKVVLAALVIVPGLYAGLLVWANLDVTGNLDQVPAAVVNLDEPVKVKGTDGKEQTVAVGRLVAANLTTSDEPSNLDWTLTTAEDADKGLADGDYYAVLTLPSDMSARATSSSDAANAAPAQMQLQTDDAVSYLSGNIAASISKAVVSDTSDVLTSAYLKNVYLGFNGIHANLADAGDGAGSLADGAARLADGAHQADAGAADLTAGLTQLDDGARQLADGTAQLSDGADQLAGGAGDLADGATQLSDGLGIINDQTRPLPAMARQLADGATQLTDGAAELGNAATRLGTGGRQIADGATQLGDNAAQLASGASDAATGADQVVSGLASAGAGADQLSAGVTSYTQGVDQLAAQCAASGAAPAFCQQLAGLAQQSAGLRTGAADLATSVDQLHTGAGDVATGVHGVATGAGQLATGAHQLATNAAAFGDGADQLKAGGDQLSQAGPQLQAGLDTLAAQVPALVEGIARSSAGAERLSSGASDLAWGADRLATGAQQSADGATQLADATSQAVSGADQLQQGTSQVASGADDLSAGATKLADGLTSGVDQVPTYDKAERNQLADVVSTPITDDVTRAHAVPSYGYGLAPYFLALALWVGGMSLYLILRPVSRRSIASSAASWRVTLAGYAPGALLGLVQVAVLAAVVLLGLDLDIADLAGFLTLAVFASLTFVAVNYALVAAFGPAGRFAALVLIVLQLASAGGTYPIQSTPGFFQWLHPLLPLSYVVTGFRSLIAGGTVPLGPAIAVLAVWLVGAMALAWFAVRRQRSWSVARLHPALTV
ncbi:MAG: YhgE/Pip domain-containing protein [Nocardioidaceae bacterium]|nr:YhgE/Pip domain-containing protein [Nocardioidaceae bacterium]